MNTPLNECFSEPKNCLTSTEVKPQQPQAYTCQKNASVSPRKVGKKMQILNKANMGDFPPPFLTLTSTVILKIPSNSHQSSNSRI